MGVLINVFFYFAYFGLSTWYSTTASRERSSRSQACHLSRVASYGSRMCHGINKLSANCKNVSIFTWNLVQIGITFHPYERFENLRLSSPNTENLYHKLVKTYHCTALKLLDERSMVFQRHVRPGLFFNKHYFVKCFNFF